MCQCTIAFLTTEFNPGNQMSRTCGRTLILLWGLFILITALLSGGCSADQQGVTTLTANNGSFPTPLPFNTSCQWNITASEGKVLRLEIRSATFRRPCSDEHLKIFDGPSASSKMIAEYCNNSNAYGHYFISSGQSLWLELKAGTGFYRMNVFYEALTKEECSPNTTLDAPQWPVEHNFSSPYWPHGYRINSTCGWFITAPADHIIKLHITSQLSWSGDKVEAYDVEDSKLSLIGRSRDDGGILYSKLQIVYVLFKTDDKRDVYFEKGVFVTYTAILPGRGCSVSNTVDENKNIVLKNSSGVIKSPGYPNNYPPDMITDCVWKIIAPKGKVIKVDFLSLQLHQYYCVKVVDGTKDLELTTRCGSKVSFTAYSSGREAKIEVINLYSFTSGTGPGFIANYTMLSAASSGTCVMNESSLVQLTGDGRTFYTPGYSVHPGIGSCSWNITVPDGMFIKLTFQEGPARCNQSFAEVFDGTNVASKSLGPFCKWDEDQVVFSSGSNLLVRFTANSQFAPDQDGGMQATYEAVTGVPPSYACSKDSDIYTPIILSNGTPSFFASYDFPLNYPNGAKCSWKLESPVGYVMQITFHSFDLQHSDDCKADYVEFKQGNFFDAKLIGRYCGSSLPSEITANHSTVFVEFVSDMSGRYSGFRASVNILPDAAMGACKKQGVDNVITLTNETGRLFSPLFPRTYPEDMMCTWIITVPKGHFVKLRIKSFRLYFDCADSYLQVRDGETSSSKQLGQFCSRNYDVSVFSSGQHLWVRFESIRSVSFSEAGFNAVFEAVKEVPISYACTGSDHKTIQLTSNSGNLASYNYPLMYDDPIECVWFIKVSTDRRIKLSFDFFDLRSSPDCADDYVEVRKDRFDSSDLVGKYCGTDKPSTITSDDWDLRIDFKSSGKGKYPGFTATYETEKTDTVVAVLKIVGIVLGALSALCLLIGAFCKLTDRSSATGDHVAQETEVVGTDNTVLDETTKV